MCCTQEEIVQVKLATQKNCFRRLYPFPSIHHQSSRTLFISRTDSLSPHIRPTDSRLPINIIASSRRRGRLTIYDLSADSRSFAVHDFVARSLRNVPVANPLSWHRARPLLSYVRGGCSWGRAAMEVAHWTWGLSGLLVSNYTWKSRG